MSYSSLWIYGPLIVMHQKLLERVYYLRGILQTLSLMVETATVISRFVFEILRISPSSIVFMYFDFCFLIQNQIARGERCSNDGALLVIMMMLIIETLINMVE